MEENKKKPIYKKWWFFCLVIIIIATICSAIISYLENKKLEEKFKNIGNSASNYYDGVKNANSYLDDFSYNYSTGTVDYNSNHKK